MHAYSSVVLLLLRYPARSNIESNTGVMMTLPANTLLVTNFCTFDEMQQRTRMTQWSHYGCPGIVYDYGNKELGGSDRVLRYCGCYCHEGENNGNT